MAMHAFVVMPFGIKEEIDFDRVYADLIKPSLEAAGLVAFRADEEARAGNIRKDMFQELLLADLVVVDASLDNPNVWYELGIRHALRERDVVIIACRNERLPFDIATDRVLRYRRKAGELDPTTLEADRDALKQCVVATMRARSDDSYRSSPVYAMLPSLSEPDWKSLKVRGDTGFWSQYDAWRRRLDVARRYGRVSDVLILAEETPTWILRSEALRAAGAALTKLGRFNFAIEQYERALELDSRDRESQRKVGVLLGRLGRFEEAREWTQKLVENYPNDAESHALMGRVMKEQWIARWRNSDNSGQEFFIQAKTHEAILEAALEHYTKAFMLESNHFYSGVNALTLHYIRLHLGLEETTTADIETLTGAVTWACSATLSALPNDYWARTTRADVCLLREEENKVVKAYRSALAVADKDWFAIDSSRQQLRILFDLGFRPGVVSAAIALFDQELAALLPPLQPQRVFLFSGHMIDEPDRPSPRFPPDMETLVEHAIDQKLGELEITPADLAISGGACGGDLLFIHACLRRGVRVEIRLPFEEAQFLQTSITFAGEKWSRRFREAKANPLASVINMPERLGSVPDNVNPHARNNRWLLSAALAYGPEKVQFISLWDGKAGDGPGGTKDMVKNVRDHLGDVHVIDAAAILNKLQEAI
jgi:tetratricopeptide (TPR) repeat protein